MKKRVLTVVVAALLCVALVLMLGSGETDSPDNAAVIASSGHEQPESQPHVERVKLERTRPGHSQGEPKQKGADSQGGGLGTESSPVPSKKPPPPIAVPSEFFFSSSPWDLDRILVTRSLNPRRAVLSTKQRKELEVLIRTSRDAIGPAISSLMRDCDAEFDGYIAGGTARESKQPADIKLGDNGSVSIGMTFGNQGPTAPKTVLQKFDGGKNKTFVAGWPDLPRTKARRQVVATDVMLLISSLLSDLESYELFTSSECDQVMSSVVEHMRIFE